MAVTAQQGEVGDERHSVANPFINHHQMMLAVVCSSCARPIQVLADTPAWVC